MSIGTMVAHRRTVSLPAHAFTARHQDRHTLSGRRLVRMPVGPVIVARRVLNAATAQSAPVTRIVVADDVAPVAPRQWPWTLASLLLIVMIVAACTRLAM